MPLIHHLARTGGTLISRCLGSMDRVCLLSEIHPAGTRHFNPLRQACDWHGLVDQSEVRDLPPDDSKAFADAIHLIASRAQQNESSLVIRDWSHLDWIGFPFVSPAMSSSWEAIGDLGPTIATVRHPVDQYRSSRKLALLRDAWDDPAMWRGMRAFAQSIQGTPWFRYEDFLAAPDRTLRMICEALSVTYDRKWKHRWADYDKVTGDGIDRNRRAIRPTERSPIEPGFWQDLRSNEDLLETLDLLKYPTPEPLRRKWFQTGAVPAPDHKQSTQNEATNWDDEVVRWRCVCEAQSNNPSARLRLAEALRWIGQWDEAADLLIDVARRDDSLSQDTQARLLVLVAETLERAERKFEAIEFRRQLAHLAPENKNNLFQLSVLLGGVGQVDESLAYCRRLLELDHHHLGAAANFLLYTNYSDRFTAAEVSNEHFRLGMRFTLQSESVPRRQRSAEQKIRIGYLGSDFYTHPVGKIMLPILQSHDRQRFHITVYHDGKKSDANTQATMDAVDAFNTVHGDDDDSVVGRIRGDSLDVLIDLGGYTGGGNRLRALSRRLAPIQASFLGYPNTSAIPCMDYRLTDRFADPPGLTEQWYGEQLVWLEHAMLAWRPYEIAHAVYGERLASTASQQPVLGLFNNVAKISPTAIATYATIMRRVPESRLILKYGDRYGVKVLQDRYRHQFAAHGVLPHRLEFREQAESLDQHLRTLASVDLALDSFPYQGTMTSLECLSVGTPIVSCCGDYYAHRATSAMMMRMGWFPLVAGDAEEYAEIAVQLLYDLQSLREMRQEIQERFHSSTLTEPAGLANELEQCFETWTQ